MSDRSRGEIWIGGKIKRELVPELCLAIRREGVGPDWLSGPFAPETEEELSEAIDDSCGVPALHFCDDQAVGGEFDILEEFLQRNGLPYRRHSGHCYWYDGRQVNYRPGYEPVEVMTNTDGNPVIHGVDDVERAWYLIKEAQQLLQLNKPALDVVIQAADMLTRALPLELPPLPPFEIAD